MLISNMQNKEQTLTNKTIKKIFLNKTNKYVN